MLEYKEKLNSVEILHIEIKLKEIDCLPSQCYNVNINSFIGDFMYIKEEVLEILSYDDELETIFAKAKSGSIVLDVLPCALDKLRNCKKYKQMYLQDHMGTEFVVPQGASLEQAEQIWQAAVSQRRGINTPIQESFQAPTQRGE